MRRNTVLLAATVLIAAACGGDSSSETTTTASTSTSSPATTTSTVAATTSTTEAATTTPTLATSVEAALIVANRDGAFLVENEFVFQLVEGPVELAMADGTGGLVFQRSSDNFDLGPRATIISYLPPDSFEPQELLVPTGEQYLTLWDVDDGAVWYSRREGDSPETATETLRTYDFANRTVEQFAVTGGWESGSISVSVGGSTTVAYWHAEATSGFTYYSQGGGIVGFEGDPYGADVFCGDGTLYDGGTGDLVGPTCYEHAVLSDDGRLAYYERDFDGAQVRFILVVADLETGEELFRQDLERPDAGWLPVAMDLRGDQILVNRTETGVWDAPYIDAFLIDLASGAVTEIGIDGQARFLVGPMGID